MALLEEHLVFIKGIIRSVKSGDFFIWSPVIENEELAVFIKGTDIMIIQIRSNKDHCGLSLVGWIDLIQGLF